MAKPFRLMFVALFLALTWFSAATPAGAALTAYDVNPDDPHGYPRWYEDSTGLQLELCVPPPAGTATSAAQFCIGDPIEVDGDGNPINPLVLTGESFWWLAETSIDLASGGEAQLTLALEATFGGNEAPVDGNQISFGRTRIRIDTPVAGIYTVTTPYQTHEFEVTDPAEGINYTADIGASNFLNTAAGFAGALNAPIGPFLTWPDYDTNPALQVLELDPVTNEPTATVLEQYVGDPNVPSTVVGGTNGNIFRVQGPGIDVQTDQFFVMGKVLDTNTADATNHVFPGEPPLNLFAVGPINRTEFFANPDPAAPLVAVTGVDYNYPVGYPLWYRENIGTPTEPVGGLQVTLCVPGDAMCISDPIDPSELTTQVALRTGGEAFWWSADALFDIGADNDRALLVLGIEATFGGDESIVDGQQITFGRVRIRVDTNTSGAGTYRVTHPYGVNIFEDVPADDNGINYTADIGIVNPTDPDSAMIGTLYSDIGPTLLRWDNWIDPATATPENPFPPELVKPYPGNPALSVYYLGDPAIEHQVVGSTIPDAGHPSGFQNFFMVERLTSGTPDNGTWELVGETDEFAVSGKIFDEETFQFAINAAAPVAVADSVTITTENSVAVSVLNNDTINGVPIPNIPGADVTINVLPVGENFGPNSGTAAVDINNPGTILYTPSAAFLTTGGVDTFAYQILDNATGFTSNTAIVTVTVDALETITVDRARFSARRLRLDLRGTSNAPGSTLTIHAGNSAEGSVIGTVLVGDAGRWSFRGTATTNLTAVTIVSSPGQTTVTETLQVR